MGRRIKNEIMNKRSEEKTIGRRKSNNGMKENETKGIVLILTITTFKSHKSFNSFLARSPLQLLS